MRDKPITPLQFWSSANRPRHPKCLLPALFPGPEDPKSKVPDSFPITVLYLQHPSLSYSLIDLLALPADISNGGVEIRLATSHRENT